VSCELLRQIVSAHYESSQADGAASREEDAERRFQQLIFEISKTRSAVLRIGLQTIPEKTMEQIPAVATHDARNYAALAAAGIDRLTAEPRRYSRQATSLAVGATSRLHQRANQPRPWWQTARGARPNRRFSHGPPG